MKVVVEIPKGSIYKYEINKDTGKLALDRVISIPYPENYGYFPNTLAQDGDPLDVFLVSDQPIAPLTEVEIEEILNKINELEQIVKSVERKSKKWDNAKGIIKWIADKGVDVGISVIPLLLQIK